MSSGSVDYKPDLIVGIDLGQTCTGVAYSLAQGSDYIRQIQKWPGAQYRNENKVPTVLVYEEGSDEPSAWGFKAEDARDGLVREWFKTLLDQDQLERRLQHDQDHTITAADVKRWYKDFLKLLYAHLKLTLAAELPNFGFDQAKIEFLFSVPTTWSPLVVDTYRGLIRQAGFENYDRPHKVTMSLTEAEAAAVYTWTVTAGIFDQNDLLVVCDAGGGTSDLCALEVKEMTGESISLKQLKQVLVVDGAEVGSAGIDMAFQKLALRKLQRADASNAMGIDVDSAAWEMQKSHHFQNVKCEFGAPSAPHFFLPVPGLGSSYVHSETGIVRGELRFDNGELQDIFDEQIRKLFSLIDKQLIALAVKEPDRDIRHLVLSGGLGQSTYVQNRLKEYYCRNENLRNIRNIQVRVAPEPQMSVCKGLVADRLRQFRTGTGVLGSRCCRASYGVVCKALHDKSLHIGRDPVRDPLDGKWYVHDCVDWLIKKGEPITGNAQIRHGFSRCISRQDPNKIFPSKIVVSYADKDKLPRWLDTGVSQLCKVESDLSVVDESKFIAKKQKFWQAGEPYMLIFYEVRVNLGPADLTFELWFEDKKISDSKAIQVQWTTSSEMAPITSPVHSVEDEGQRTQKEPNKGQRRAGLPGFRKTKK